MTRPGVSTSAPVGYGFFLPNFGPFGDPTVLVELARRAEDAGWDGFFIWDHILLGAAGDQEVADPWITLAAIAAVTTRIRFGALVTPVTRRRPWKLTSETASLDRLSNGRLVFGAGLGVPADAEFGVFHEEADAKVRAEKLDEGLEIGIGFTGSAEVGLSIISELSRPPYSRPVIAKMGGKNPVIVTDDATLEDAVTGITYSAFDLTGQKCSACSRVLVTPGIHDELVDALAERARTLVFDEPLNSDADGGPLISSEARRRYDEVSQTAEQVATVVTGGQRLDRDGYFVAPTIVSGVPLGHELARREHFLPFVTVTKISNFDEALREANAVDVGLTAGIFTGDRTYADRFRHEIQAGAININNPDHATTGFWPGSGAFGGWKGSGSGGKLAYGQWYVAQFAREQCCNGPSDLL